MNKLWLAMGISLLGHIVAWFHMQAQFRWEWAKSVWWVILGGIPVSFAFYYGTRWYYEYFGNYWYVRPIGFGMATIVFGFLTWLMLGESPDIRTWISIVLSAVIILIQLSHLFIK
tara:strand:+ start:590 stop:934 length:345 start_codon:yes stop_codon:yes gene_type:complete